LVKQYHFELAGRIDRGAAHIGRAPTSTTERAKFRSAPKFVVCKDFALLRIV